MQRADVAILGAGVFGLSIAWHCAAAGLSVRVHEAKRVGAGASGGLIGALSPHMPEKWNDKKAFQFEALRQAPAFWGAIAKASGLDPGFQRQGRVIPLRNEAARALAAERATQARALWQGYAEWRVIDEAKGVAPASHGFVRETLSAQLFPIAAMAALAQACRAKGVEISENDPRRAEDCQADITVIASGHQTRDLLPESLAPLAQGVKGQSALLGLALPSQPIIFDDGLYVIAHGQHGTAVGSTSEKTWQNDETDALLDPLIARARALVPALSEAPVTSRWSGIRPRARLPDPVIGALAPNQILATGGFKIGLGLGPKIGECVAKLIAGKDPDLPPSFTLEHQKSLLGV